MPLLKSNETIKVIADLIETEMGFLPEEHRVFIYNQKWNIPSDSGCFVNVDFLGSKVIGSNSKVVDNPENDGGMVNRQCVNMQEIYQVDIFSADSSARIRKHEIVMAFQSITAQQACEENAFKFGQIPSSFVDLSEVEGSARLNRYSITFNVTRAYGKETPVAAFTVFQNPPKTILTNQ
jgi:hypothetical protein